MILNNSGHIINMSSLAGKKGIVKGGAYCASKFGIAGFTEVLALECIEYNIKVSAIYPGIVDTPFHGSVKDTSWMLTPEDVAKFVVETASSSSNTVASEIIIKPLATGPAKKKTDAGPSLPPCHVV